MVAAQREILPRAGTELEVILKKNTYNIITIAVGCLTLLLCIYIMLNGLGLVPELDFGAGAYYYADIPDFEKYMHEGAYSPGLPLWVYILLFLCWGYLMWRLWIWVDRRRK